MSRSAAAACLLLLVVARPLAGQGHADRVAPFARFGALMPRSPLASVGSSGRLLLERAGWVGIGAEYDPAATLPLISASIEQSIGGELIVRTGDVDRPLGPATLTALLVEAGFRRELADHLTGRAILGAGVLRYDFSAGAELRLARMFEERVTPRPLDAHAYLQRFARMLEEQGPSLAGVVGVALTVRIDRFAIALSARNMISTFDSPPPTLSGEILLGRGDVGLRQDDLVLTLSVGYRARGEAARSS